MLQRTFFSFDGESVNDGINGIVEVVIVGIVEFDIVEVVEVDEK